MKKSPKELGTEPVGSLLMKYAIPAVIAMTATSLYNIIDRIFIGQGVGPLAISGLAVTFPIMNLSAAFGAMIGAGGSTLISVKLGQRDYDTAQKILGNIVTLNIILGIIFAITAIIFIDPILMFFGASENTIGYARDYMFIILLGNVVTHLYLGLNAAVRSTGHPKTAMFATISAVIINAALDPLFIYVFDMGIAGAAWATNCAQFVGLLFVLNVLRNKEEMLHLRRGIYRLSKRIVKNILTIGLSPFCMQLCACFVVILINQGLQTTGGDLAIGAYGIVNGITFMFIMIVMGITQGMQPIAGYNYGAEKFDRVTKVLKYSILYATVVMCVSFALCMSIPEILIGMFTDDAELTTLAVEGMRIIVIVNPIIGFQIVVGHFFQSIGMPKKSIFLSLSRQLLFLIPMLLILPNYFGTKGVWFSIPAADAFSVFFAIVMLWRFYKTGGYKNNEITI